MHFFKIELMGLLLIDSGWTGLEERRPDSVCLRLLSLSLSLSKDRGPHQMNDVGEFSNLLSNWAEEELDRCDR